VYCVFRKPSVYEPFRASFPFAPAKSRKVQSRHRSAERHLEPRDYFVASGMANKFLSECSFDMASTVWAGGTGHESPAIRSEICSPARLRLFCGRSRKSGDRPPLEGEQS
jgi:hypothetical protein